MLVNISGHLAAAPLFERVPAAGLWSTSIPASRSSGTPPALPGAASEGHDLHFTIGELHRHAELRDPDGRDRLAPGAAAGRARRLAATSSRRWRPLHDDRRAGAAPFGPIEHGGETLRAEGRTSSAKFIELPDAVGARVRDRARHPPRRRRRPAALEQPRLAHRRPRDASPATPTPSAPTSRGRRRVLRRPGRLRRDRGAAGSATARRATSRRAGPRSSRTRASVAPSGRRGPGRVPHARGGGGGGGDHRRLRAHSQAARALAEGYFDSDLVLTRFLDAAGVG